MMRFSSVLVGSESLLIQCGDILLQRGLPIRAVITRSAEVRAWAARNGLRCEDKDSDFAATLAQVSFDWLFSVANMTLIPQAVIDLAARGAINFHDGPLPEYAGLNTPVWALLNGETRHGVTWHIMDGGIDTGDIVEQRLFAIAPDETALTLNARCFAAGIDSFTALIDRLQTGPPERRAQDINRRRLYRRGDRPAAMRLDFTRPAGEIAALVRALDHGAYRNPLACPRIEAGGRVLLVARTEPQTPAGDAPPGTVLAVDADGLSVAAADGAVRLEGLRGCRGAPVCPMSVAEPGAVLASPTPSEAAALSQALARLAPGEEYWTRSLRDAVPAELPMAGARGESGAARERTLDLPAGLAGTRLIACVAALGLRLSGKPAVDLAWRDAAIAGAEAAAPGHVCGWVPLRFGARDADPTLAEASAALEARLQAIARHPGFAADLFARDPAITATATPQLGIATGPEAALIDGTAATVALSPEGGARLICDPARLTQADCAALAARLEHLAQAVATGATDTLALSQLPILSKEERRQLIEGWNATSAAFDSDLTVHRAFEAQAARTPEATALIFEDRSLTYAELNAQANRAAHVLRAMGVGPEVPVGLHLARAPEMLVAALGILKAGGAYVPLDPAYPAERIAHYIADSAAPVIVTRSDLAGELPAHEAELLLIDADDRLAAAPETDPEGGAGAENLAYLIYTSGSTGQPKGVMVEHRNVANFLAGMDAYIRRDPPGVWLAVTSLSFDISVLELFWTLARGFKVVLTSDADRAAVSGGGLSISERGMDFSLFYWGNDDGPGPKKYELLLEGAKFADAHGFRAIWTPERHFHAFGGPYPNPAVTGAAVAAVTRNLDVRAGSCVVPLHHPARIAEEWAVIDNLTAGRTGIGVASGWQPDDFVLRPENAPPENKPAMYSAIEQLRALWRGETVEFPRADGSLHAVLTQPRPVSKELPIWVTTAGNPETWREAGALGANVLTHLLGQSIDEVGEKVAIYRAALAEAGHDPQRFTVTLMLHTFVARDRDLAREVARGPMKDYLRAAAGLVKQYAWAFPAFKKPAGVEKPMDIDLGTLDADEMEGILEFAFRRYFEDSGLFGTVEDCLARVERLKAIGVDEVACLIDYGIPVEKVMEGLYPLAEVLRRANAPTGLAEDDFSIAAQILRHGVTHLQCTPSLARMLTMDDAARDALAGVEQMLVGGEALPGALAAELAGITGAPVLNMYGPTETTIWSATETAGAAAAQEATVNIGTPIANTRLYVLDAGLEPAPVGVPGELYIAGAGVTRGYWQRPEMTAERFLPDPFVPGGGRMYRTGDLVRRRADGRLDFLGRVDAQVKIRGHRIEPGEVEARLTALPGIRQAVVIAREDAPGDVRLVAYVIGDAPGHEAAVRAALAAALPEHMVPAHVVALNALPLTPNGKIDRKALPAPAAARAETPSADYVAPVSDVEATIAGIWSRVLGVERIGAQDNFFALGGHSLLAVQAHRELRAALGSTRLSITDIFRFPTLAALAAHLDDRPGRAPQQDAPAQARNDAISRRRALRARREARAG